MKKKRTYLLLIILLITLFCSLHAIAASSEAQKAAQALADLGLFQGTEQGFELDRVPTRQEAAVLLVRLLGAEQTATNGVYPHTFQDVAAWAEPHVGYAYQNGLLQGKTETLFGGGDPTTAPQFLTFVLRALGYQSGEDFSWQQAAAFANQLGLTNGEYDGDPTFTRGDAAILCYRALSQTCKDSQDTLLQRIQQQDASAVSGLKVYFLDVGQGDCTLIQINGLNILIDAGNPTDAEAICAYLQALGLSRLDHLIATHAHADHIGGMSKVVQQFEIGAVYMSKAPANTKTYENLLDAIAAKGLTIKSPAPGTSYTLGGATLEFLSPSKQYTGLNDNSLVCKLRYGDHSILFAGDMEQTAEADLLQQGYQPQATVLKVAHHGSDTSSSQAFLDAVTPAYAVISVGKDNSYGHPSQTVLDRLSQLGAKIYRTDQSGTLQLTSDGKTLLLAAADPPQNTTGSYIGNLNSKKFHLATCSGLPAEKNRIVFPTRSQAIQQGYIPAGCCNP